MLLFLAPLFLSFDSFLGSFALGFGERAKRRRIGLAVAFGLCDALASATGIFAGRGVINRMPPEEFSRALVAAYVLLLAVCVLSRRASSDSPSRMIWTAPMVMSLDNLIQPSQAAASAGAICVAAAASAMASWLGFYLADTLRCLWRRGFSEPAAISPGL